jgi:hypothetical protein
MLDIYNNARQDVVMSFKDPKEMNADVRKMLPLGDSGEKIYKFLSNEFIK